MLIASLELLGALVHPTQCLMPHALCLGEAEADPIDFKSFTSTCHERGKLHVQLR